ncbi:nuclear transport factor 2 family protein [Nocardia heshunensis]
MIDDEQVGVWVDGYVHAWNTNAAKDIARLFSKDAEYHEWPYQTDWVGRDAIVDGWRGRLAWQQGGWTFDWSILMITGDTAAIQGVGRYTELGDFANLWTVTFDLRGKCSMFRMWNNQL